MTDDTAQADAMSEERRAEIRAAADRERWNTYCGHVGPRTMVTELLAEVERLQTQAAYMREQIEQQAQVIEERKTQTVAYRALAEEHQKRGDKLSAQLAEHPSQWEVRRAYPNGNTIVLVGLDETQARVELAENGGVLFERCAAGEWCEVPNA